MVFLFTKGMGTYFYDLEATRVGLQASSVSRLEQDVPAQEGSWRANGGGKTNGPLRAVGDPSTGRNAWNWMTFKPSPSSLEHYAGYPPQLPEFCIKAGTSERGVCPQCGAPWARVLYTGEPEVDPRVWSAKGQRHYDDATGGYVDVSPATGSTLKHTRERTTTAWRPTCPAACHQGRPAVPATVLDCFSGSGTTLMVADRLGRNALGCELKPDYAAMSKRRVTGDAPLFADVTLEGAAAG